MESDSVDHSRDGNSANKNYLYQNRLKFSFHVIFLLTLERCERTMAAKRFLATKHWQPQSVRSQSFAQWMNLLISCSFWRSKFTINNNHFFRLLRTIFLSTFVNISSLERAFGLIHLDCWLSKLRNIIFMDNRKFPIQFISRDPNITFYFIVSRRPTAAT